MPRLHPATLFSAAALFFGAFYMAVLPPLSTPDAGAHFLRAVQISQGQWLPDEIAPKRYGGTVPLATVEILKTVQVPRDALPVAGTIRERLRTVADGGTVADFSGAAAYPPLAYLPQAAGLALGDVLGLDLLSGLYLACLANLLAFIAVTALAIRLAPGFHGTIALTALLPLSFSQAATVSADPLNFAIPLLLVCAALHLRTREGPLPLAVYAPAALLTLSLGLLKPTTPAFGLALLLIGRRLGPWPKALAGTLVPVALALAIAVGWSAAFPFVPGEYFGRQADPLRQVLSLVSDPLTLGRVAVATVMDRGWIYWHSAFGLFTPLPGDGLHWAPTPLAVAALAGLILQPVLEAKEKPDYRAALVLYGIGAIVIVGIVLAFWLSFTTPGELIVRGVQGRYLTPAYACLFLAIGAASRGTAPRRWRDAGVVFLLIVYAVTALYAAGVYGVLPLP